MLPLFIMAIENDTDRQFVAGLYQRHRDFLLRCAQKILNDPDRAEEALHEAMLRVIRSLERVRQILTRARRKVLAAYIEKGGMNHE